MSDLKVLSGKCVLCDVGLPAKAKDCRGVDIHTGDIVIIWHGSYVGTELEEWQPGDGMTVVVADQYQSYSNGDIKRTGDINPFVMGIKDCGFNHPEWRVRVVKKYHDVIEGEHWPEFGFSYKLVEVAS